MAEITSRRYMSTGELIDTIEELDELVTSAKKMKMAASKAKEPVKIFIEKEDDLMLDTDIENMTKKK